MLQALQSWEKSRVDGGRFHVLQLLGDIAGHTEVGVLVDRCRNQTRHVLARAEDVREGIRKGRHGLDRGIGELAHVVRLVKTKNALDLVEVHMLLHLNHVCVHGSDVLGVEEHKGLLGVETESKDVFNVAEAHLGCTFLSVEVHVLVIQVLFVISDLDNKRNVKSLLEILRKHHWNAVAHVHGISGRTSSSVEIKWFLGLICL